MNQPSPRTGNHLAPYPVVKHIVTVVQEGQDLTDEQRERVADWLQANGLGPGKVSRGEITITYKVCGTKPGKKIISFEEYYTDDDGHRVYDPATCEAAKFRRHVEQSVELAQDPAWMGWDQWEKETAAKRAAVSAGDA